MPVGTTGRLRNSIQVAAGAPSGAAGQYRRSSSARPMPHFVEFGTARTSRPARRLCPIIRRAREAFVQAVIDRVKAEGLEVTGG